MSKNMADEIRDIIQKWARRGYVVPDVATDIEDDIAGVVRPLVNKPMMPYVLLPIMDEYGTCHEFKLSRSDGKHLSRVDVDEIRAAFGQIALEPEEYPRFLADDEWFPA